MTNAQTTYIVAKTIMKKEQIRSETHRKPTQTHGTKGGGAEEHPKTTGRHYEISFYSVHYQTFFL
jgi:hypothetical protein